MQARTGSKRLPGKMLMKIGKFSVLEIIIKRLKKCKKIKKIIIATTKNTKDDAIVKIAKKNKVFSFRGSTNDLVSRYYFAAKKFKVNPIVRFPGDNLFPCPNEIDKIINFFLKKNQNIFCSNIEPIKKSGYPTGIGAEVFSFQNLEKIFLNERNNQKREHIHLNFINYKKGIPANKKFCEIFTIKAIKRIKYPKIVLHIDYLNEFLLLKKVFLNFNRINIQIDKVLKFIDKNKHEYHSLYKK